jgi:hypothetical protein
MFWQFGADLVLRIYALEARHPLRASVPEPMTKPGAVQP